MPATYSGDPSTSPKDETRFLCGDTGGLGATPVYYLQDAEVNYEITRVYGTNPPPQGNYLPAANCADDIAAKLARNVDSAVGDLKISYSNLLKQFSALAISLRRRATMAGVPVYFGGQSLSQKYAAYSNPDLIQPASQIDGMDNNSTAPGASQLQSSNQTTVP